MSGQKYGYDTDDDPVDENYNDEAISGEEELEEVWDLQGSPIRGLHEEAVEDDEEENVNEELDPIDVAFDEYSAAYLASPVLPYYPTPIAVLANNLVPEPYMAFILEEVVASDRHEFAISKPTDIDYQKNHPLAKIFKNSGGGYSKEVAFFAQSKEVSQDRCINRMVHRFHDITGLSAHWHGCRVNDTSRNTYVRGDRNHPVPVMVRRRNEKGETVYRKKTNPQEESQQHALCAKGAANAMPASCFYSNYRLVDKDGSDIGPAIGFGSSLHYISFIESKKENYLFAISDGTLSQASDEHHALHTELDPIIEKISKAKELLKACSEKEPNRRAKLQALLKLRGQKNAVLDKMLEVLSDARLLCRRVDPHNGYFFITWSQRRMIVGFVRLVAAIRCQNCVNFQRFITRDDLGLFYQRTTKRSIPQEFMKAADLHNDGSRNLGSDFVVGPLQALKGWGLVDMSDREQYIALRNRFKKYRADIDLDRSHLSYRLCKSDDNYSGRTLAERKALETANLEAEAALEAIVDTTGPVHQSSNDDEDHAAVPMAKEPSAKKARLDKKKVTKVEVPKKKPTQPFESVAPVILNHVSADYTQNHGENIAMDPTNAKHEDIDMDIDLCNNQSTEVLPDDEIRDVSSSLDKINCSERAGESIDDVKDKPDDDTDAVVETEQKLLLCEAITSDISNIVHTVTEHNRIQDENIVADSYVAGVELPNTVQDKANTGNLDESDGGLGSGITPVITCSADDVNKDDTCNMVENNINKQLDKPSDGSKNKLETGPEAVVDTSTNVTCWDDIVIEASYRRVAKC